VEEVFKMIPYNTLAEDLITEENIQRIAHMMDGYRQEIEKLVENMTPTTPP
jgi:hypothetical protein